MNFFLTSLTLALAFTGLGFGVFFSMKIFNVPDITTDGSYTLGGSVAAILLSENINPWLVLLICIFCGFIAGCTTGLIYTRLKVNPLLAGILVMTSLYSINLKSMQRSNIPLIDTPLIYSLPSFIDQAFSSFIWLGLATIVILLLLYFFLRTDLGILLRATGSSEIMVRANGANSCNIKTIGLGIANALTAISGFLVVQIQGFADINMGVGIIIPGLGAVIIGDTLYQLTQRSSLFLRLLFVIIGTILFRLILAFVLSQGIDPTWLKLTMSLIVLLIVAIPFRNKIS